MDGSEIMNAMMLFTSSRAESHVSAILLFIFMHKVNHFFCINFSVGFTLYLNALKNSALTMGCYFSLKEKYDYESQDNLKPVLF